MYMGCLFFLDFLFFHFFWFCDFLFFLVFCLVCAEGSEFFLEVVDFVVNIRGVCPTYAFHFRIFCLNLFFEVGDFFGIVNSVNFLLPHQSHCQRSRCFPQQQFVVRVFSPFGQPEFAGGGALLRVRNAVQRSLFWRGASMPAF